MNCIHPSRPWCPPFRLAAGLLLLLAGLSLGWGAPAAAQRGGFAGASGPGTAREVSDQDRARIGMKSGQNRSLEELLSRARVVGRGEYLGVEPDIHTNIYRFKFLRPGGNVVWVDMDGRTGRVIAERQ